MTRRSKTIKHPRFAFIEIRIETEGGDKCVSSTVDGDALEHGYIAPLRMPLAECVEWALRNAEQAFFYEGGGAFYHWRGKIDEAAQNGDMDALCALAEGRGYWQGVRAASEEIRRGARHFATSRVPLFESKLSPSNLYPERAEKTNADAPAPCEDDIPF
jgi:hypothetical protein